MSNLPARTIRAGMTYFALVFGAGFILGSIRVPCLVPRLGERAAELIEMPFMFVVVLVSMIGQTIRERSVLIDGDIAIVFGTADLKFAGPDNTESLSSLRYTATYTNRQGQWRMLALQMQKRASE